MEEKTERAGRKRKTLLVFIAVFAVLAAIAAALYAAYQQNLFGFGDIVNNSIHAGESTDADVGPDSDGVSGEPVQEDFYLPMSIYTPEHRAAEQWFEFIDSYDISWRSEMGMEEPYMAYSYEPIYGLQTAYMQFKLEQIAEKNGLSLVCGSTENYVCENLAEMGVFIGDKNTAYCAYMFYDGSYKAYGILDGDGKVKYELISYKKGTFLPLKLEMEDINEMEQWQYELSDSDSAPPLQMYLGRNQGMISAEMENAYITINVLAGSQGEYEGDTDNVIDAIMMEEYAGYFDWDVLSKLSELNEKDVMTIFKEEGVKIEDRAFFGEYLVTGRVWKTEVCGLSEDEIENYFNTYVSYSDALFYSLEGGYADPYYNMEPIYDSDALFSGYGFIENGDEISDVLSAVVVDYCGFGDIFFIVDEKTILIVMDEVLFEAVKVF